MSITNVQSHGQDAAEVTSAGCRFVYQLEAGGFSVITDPSGTDWIQFAQGEPRVPDGAANIFRGLPNMVNPDDIGHPGHRNATTAVDEAAGVLRTQSRDGGWGWNVRFVDTFAVFDVHLVPADRKYWFLYEGTPAGGYDYREFLWGTNAGAGEPLAEIRAGRDSIAYPTVQWGYVTKRGYPWALVVALADGTQATSMFCRMNADDNEPNPATGMVVFGLGRGPKTSSLLEGAHRLAAGFVSADGGHEAIAERITAALAGL